MTDAPTGTSGLFEGAFRAAFEHSMDGILITIPDGRIVAANPAACRILATTEEDICLRGRQGFSDPSEPRWQAALEERNRTGQVVAVVPMRRADGTPFLAEVASSLFVGPRGEQRSSVVLRDVTERVRLQQQIRASHEITQALLAGEATAAVLGLIASRARSLVDATDAAIFMKTDAAGTVTIAATDGPRISDLLGTSYPPGTLAARVLDSGRSLLVEDLSAIALTEEGRRLGFGPGIMVPIISGGRAFGDLLVASSESLRRPFGSVELDVVESFAEAAGLALALGEARAEVERLAVAAEQNRIGAELHDSVIQQLFAVGLHLLELKATAPPGMADKVEESVHDVDTIISDIRNTIFSTRTVHGEGIEDSVNRLAMDAGRLLGFDPHVAIAGSEVIGASTGSQLVLVLREALSNVVRHSRATRVDVSLSVEGEEVVLRVTDDGVGPPQDLAVGWGIENMAQRAASLGGSFSVQAATPSGTCVEWKAPAEAHPRSPLRVPD